LIFKTACERMFLINLGRSVLTKHSLHLESDNEVTIFPKDFVPTLTLFHRWLAQFIELNLRYMFVIIIERK
jgi:hypothetical protein